MPAIITEYAPLSTFTSALPKPLSNPHLINTNIHIRYRKFAGAKFRPLDEAYIAGFNANRFACILNTSILTDGEANGAYYSLAASQSTMLPTPPASEKSVDDGEIEVETQEGRRDAWGIGQILTL